MGLFPRIFEHSLQVHSLLTVWAGLFLANYAPTSDTKFMESKQELRKIFHRMKTECKWNHVRTFEFELWYEGLMG